MRPLTHQPTEIWLEVLALSLALVEEVLVARRVVEGEPTEPRTHLVLVAWLGDVQAPRCLHFAPESFHVEIQVSIDFKFCLLK